MSAKSVPQLPVSPLNHVSSAAMHVRGSLFILVVALSTAGASWFLSRDEVAPRPVAIMSHAEAFAASEALMDASAPALAPAAPAEAERPPVDNRRYRALSQFLAKRYRVSQAVTLDLVTMAHAAGNQIGVDPLLIIAVIAVESRFNPIAESSFGAKGLMQIIPKYHSDKFRDLGGVKAIFDPETNILVGSKIIKEYMIRTGNLSSALQLYGGVSTTENDVYFSKVMSEKQRLHQVLGTKS